MCMQVMLDSLYKSVLPDGASHMFQNPQLVGRFTEIQEVKEVFSDLLIHPAEIPGTGTGTIMV